MEDSKAKTQTKGENTQKREGRAPRGGNNNKDGNNARKDRPRTAKEGGEKQDRPRRERRERPQREKVTLETVIPEIPPKNQRIPEPKDEDFKKKLDDFDKQIDGKFKELKKFIEDTLKAAKAARQQANKVDNKDSGVSGNLSEKIAESKTLNAEFKVIRNKFNAKKDELNDLDLKLVKLKDKLKGRVGLNKEQLENELKALNSEYSNGHISLQREKEVIKQMDDIKKVLPLIGPLDDINKQLKVVKEQKGAIGKEMNAQWSKLDAVNNAIKEHKSQLDSLKQDKDESNNNKGETQTLIDEKRAAVNAEIEKLRASKKQYKEEYFVNKDKYYEQQDLIQRAEFMKKIKDKLIRDQERQKEYEERKKQREEEEKLIDESPYKEEQELCQLLIEYCQKLKPTQVKQQDTVQTEVNTAEIEKALKGADWKKDNVTLFTKQAVLDDLNYGYKKNKGKKNAKKEQPQVEQHLNHQVEVLNYFDNMKITAPQTLKDLDETIKQCQEKKSYYENLPKDAKREETQTNTQTSQPKSHNKKKAKQEFVEEEFPTL